MACAPEARRQGQKRERSAKHLPQCCSGRSSSRHWTRPAFVRCSGQKTFAREPLPGAASAQAGKRFETVVGRHDSRSNASASDFELFASALLDSSEGAHELADYAQRFPGRTSVAGLATLLAKTLRPGLRRCSGSCFDIPIGRLDPVVVAAANRLCAVNQPEANPSERVVDGTRSWGEERGRAQRFAREVHGRQRSDAHADSRR